MNASSLRLAGLFLRLSASSLRKIQLPSLLAGCLLLLTQIASAAIYTVTNTADSGAGSLRDAITQVNARTGGDTINFQNVTGTITVGSTLAITESVTINGPGANLLSISGNNAVRVFSVARPRRTPSSTA